VEKEPFNWMRLGFIAILLICTGLGGWYALTRAKAATAPTVSAPAAPAPVPVTPVTIAKKDVPIYLDGLGTVQAYNSVTVRTQVDGQITNVAFTEGQDVKKGDLLVQIDPQPFEAQLQQAQARKMQDAAKIPQDEAKVKQDNAKVQQDQAKKQQDEANLANARVNLRRLEEAVKANAVTQQAVEDQRTLVISLTAASAGDDAAILGDQAAVKADEAAIEADRAAVEADDAAIKYAQTQLAYTTIHSPIDGRVGIRLVDIGNVVHITDANGIVLVTQLQPISLIFTLPQSDLHRIQARMAQAKLPVLALDPTNQKELDQGVLELVDNQIDQSTGTIRLKATFQNPGHKLWPGGFVNARLLLDTMHDALVVAEPAVQHGPDGTYIYAIKADTKDPAFLVANVQKVKVSLNQNGEAVIKGEGLAEGDQVVLTGQDRLKPGARVSVGQPKEEGGAPSEGGRKKVEKDSAGSSGGSGRAP
jgi:multidrug efflux system membrane fusion protein